MSLRSHRGCSLRRSWRRSLAIRKSRWPWMQGHLTVDNPRVISMTTNRPSRGSPRTGCCSRRWWSTPTSRRWAMPKSRIRWYLSRSVSVIAVPRSRVAGVHAHRDRRFDRHTTTLVFAVAHQLELLIPFHSLEIDSPRSAHALGTRPAPAPAIPGSTSSAVCAMPSPYPPW